MLLDYLLYVVVPFIMRLIGTAVSILAFWAFAVWLWHAGQGQTVTYLQAVKLALHQIGLPQ